MRIVCPTKMTSRQARALKVCMASGASAFMKEDVLAAVGYDMSAIEEGARSVGYNFPVPGAGTIDVIAIDRNGKALLVSVHDRLDVQALCASFARAEWIVDSREVVEHIFPGISAGPDTRSWHFAGSVSREVGPMLRRMGSASPEVFECSPLRLADEEWLFIKKHEAAGMGGAVASAEKTPPRSPRPVYIRSLLTDEEIGDFLDSEKAAGEDEEDEITSSCRL
ncbi:MAG: hypothetical protein V2A66_02845 [Pseudomonadota bacterium]